MTRARRSERTEQQGTCDCVPVWISSRACRKCGRTGIITQEELNEHLVDLAQFHYVLTQIRDGVGDEAQDMASRVLDGERSVRPLSRGTGA